MIRKIRVLIVDDSAVVRDLLTKGLSKDEMIEVVGAASDPYDARDKILEYRPDMITLDIIMPKMSGLNFLRKLMPQYPMPVLMISSLTEKGKKITIDALSLGAYDFVTKPSNLNDNVQDFIDEIIAKIKMTPDLNVQSWDQKDDEKASAPLEKLETPQASAGELSDKLIVIGASTGGTEAVSSILASVDSSMPPVIVAQHMPPFFTEMFAECLNETCPLEVREAKDGDKIEAGIVYISPGGINTIVDKVDNNLVLKCYSDNTSSYRPSVSELFFSVAKHVGKNALGVILTGMGGDGADGMLAMKNSGAHNLAQDETTSLIFGMPKAAIDKGGVSEVLPLNQIAKRINEIYSKK